MLKPYNALGLSLGLISAISASSVFAQSNSTTAVNYNHAGLRYIEQNLDDYDCNQDGLSAYGNYAIDSNWFATGSVTDVSGDNGCGSTTLRAGAGYHTPLHPGWDLYGTLSVERTDPDYGSSDTGLVAAVGARGWILQKLEGKAELAHHTVYSDTTQLNLGANYWITPVVSATLDTGLSSDGESIALGARVAF
ncbi:porin family protein [Gilvimarinus agarilyticus]|uniref:porin family protein n=1 Tax=Gilvimarinus sp. 2_MG-2023 TaxID=3062666 RepID=UPI001C08553A|nr:porin family protein [Gilvimarinus sp. 2_MG-2023]MBU2886797.1 porin family protein [Gilvimarinus agarilyticus]MDO6571461.1 porin family protein [Gilvimarinus sp. 2_MG-2023]